MPGHPHAALQPRLMRFGLLRVRSPLLTESQLISVPELLRWFTSLSMAPLTYFIQSLWCIYHYMRVTPFGYLRVKGYVLLTAAFRSLSRPSSPYSSIGIHHEPMFRLTILSFSPSLYPKSANLFYLSSTAFSDLLVYKNCSSPSKKLFLTFFPFLSFTDYCQRSLLIF